MQYRPEIDGLRAVAVIPVILFHADFGAFEGGFVGVDVFFVISGYLISSILISDLEKGEFSLVRFYERRARRILPALFAVMLVCVPLAWQWMLPAEFANFSQSIVAVVFFSSNILFWRESGYFSADAEEKPLLHTWSLAVEEQFYLLFPVVLLLLWRFGRKRVFWSLVAVALSSFLLCEWTWRIHPAATFYLAPTRAWELLTGSLVALLISAGNVRSNNTLSLLGLVMILMAAFSYSAATPFPSAYALAPVIGTALVIMFAGPGTLVARALSLGPIVGLGLISYSAYLWHQPLFAFARIQSFNEPSGWLLLALAVLSLFLAYVTWHFVEQPFRRSRPPRLLDRRALAVACVGTGTVFAMFGGYGHSMEGNVYRYPPNRLHAFEQSVRTASLPDRCQRNGFEGVASEPCVLGDQDLPTTVAVVGDSHAMQLAAILQELTTEVPARIDVYAKTACSPAEIRYFYAEIMRFYSECWEWRDAVFSRLLAAPPDLILLTNSSIGYLSGDLTIEDYIVGLGRTFARFSEAEIPLLYLQDNPQFRSFDPASCFAHAYFDNETEDRCYLDREIALGGRLRTQELRLGESYDGVEVIDLSHHFCDADFCYAGDENGVFMRDSNHLSALGVQIIGNDLKHHVLRVLLTQKETQH